MTAAIQVLTRHRRSTALNQRTKKSRTYRVLCRTNVSWNWEYNSCRPIRALLLCQVNPPVHLPKQWTGRVMSKGLSVTNWQCSCDQLSFLINNTCVVWPEDICTFPARCRIRRGCLPFVGCGVSGRKITPEARFFFELLRQLTRRTVSLYKWFSAMASYHDQFLLLFDVTKYSGASCQFASRDKKLHNLQNVVSGCIMT